MKYITVKEYAKKYGVTVKTVYNRIDRGDIPKGKIKKVLSTMLIADK